MDNKFTYRGNAIISWTFESNSHKALEQARKFVSDLVGDSEDIKVTVNVDRYKEKTPKIVLGEFSLLDVLPFITSQDSRRVYKIGDKEYEVRMNSPRYFVFKSSHKCASCGIEGSVMMLERHPLDKKPHFNLYARDGDKLILMTKDHIQAKSYGGEDRHSNYQTMCCICNNLKGNDNLKLDAIRTLREIYNNNKQLHRKKLNAMINRERERLRIPHEWETASSQKNTQKKHLTAKCDLAIMESPDGLIAVSIYESVDKKGMRHVACVKKGAVLTPLSTEEHCIRVAFNETTFALYPGYTEN